MLFFNSDKENNKNKKETKKVSKSSLREQKFEKQADYYGLTKREREICKLENMTPEEFVEAEEDFF